MKDNIERPGRSAAKCAGRFQKVALGLAILFGIGCSRDVDLTGNCDDIKAIGVIVSSPESRKGLVEDPISKPIQSANFNIVDAAQIQNVCAFLKTFSKGWGGVYYTPRQWEAEITIEMKSGGTFRLDLDEDVLMAHLPTEGLLRKDITYSQREQLVSLLGLRGKSR